MNTTATHSQENVSRMYIRPLGLPMIFVYCTLSGLAGVYNEWILKKYYLESLVGSWPHDEQKYREFSPIFVVDTIASPLLILHGADDVVVPVEQSKMIAEKLQLLGQAVELHIYDGQGHGWRAPEVMADELTKIDEFLQRHVAGAHRIYTAKADNT